jgi:hypothetical protein
MFFVDCTEISAAVSIEPRLNSKRISATRSSRPLGEREINKPAEPANFGITPWRFDRDIFLYSMFGGSHTRRARLR